MINFNLGIGNRTVQKQLCCESKTTCLDQLTLVNEALLIVLDFSAAFDTIDHDFLFCLFHQRFGLPDTVFDWIASFFRHQRYFVSTGKYTSNPHPLQFGVPQGSVLGPLLLSLYFTTRTDLCCPRLEGYAVR